MNRAPLAAVTVVGGGQVALLAAVAIARTSPRTRITVIATAVDRSALADTAHTTLHSLDRLHRRLGIDEGGMLTRADASHRLATFYEGFGPAPFAVAFGAPAATGLVPGWRSDAAEEAPAIGAALAHAERFAAPSDDPTDSLADLDYVLRFAPRAHVGRLASLARHLGVGIVPGEVRAVERTDTGDVAALVLANGERVTADIVIDASGPHTLVRRAEFVDWSSRLLVDRLLHAAPLPPTLGTRDFAKTIGEAWLLRSPGRDQTRVTLGYRSARTTDEQAATILRSTGAEPGSATTIAPGRAAEAWTGNVIAVGDAAATLEPLGATNLHLAIRQIELLMEALPSPPLTPPERTEFNRRAALLAESVADYVAAHHARHDLDRSESLARTLDLYARRGYVARWGEDGVARDLWVQLLAGVIGPRADAPALAVAPATRTALAAREAQRVAHAVAAARPYPAWLADELRRLA